MDKPYLRKLSKPTLENPVFVQGFPGFGNVGRIAAHLLIKFCDAKLFAELYSPTFPDYVSIDPKGICQFAKIRVLLCSDGEEQLGYYDRGNSAFI